MLELLKKYFLLRHFIMGIGVFIGILILMFLFGLSESTPQAIVSLFQFGPFIIALYVFVLFLAKRYPNIVSKVKHYLDIIFDFIKRKPLLKHILIGLSIFLACYLLLVIKFCPCGFGDSGLYHFLALFLYGPPIFGIYILIVLSKYKYYKTIIGLLIGAILIGCYFIYSSFQSKNNIKKEIEIYQQNKLNQENELLKKGEYYNQYNKIQNNNSLSTSEKQGKIFQLNKSFGFIN